MLIVGIPVSLSMGRHNATCVKKYRERQKQLKKLKKLRLVQNKPFKKLSHRKNYFCNVDVDTVSSGTDFSHENYHVVGPKSETLDSQASVDVGGPEDNPRKSGSESTSEPGSTSTMITQSKMEESVSCVKRASLHNDPLYNKFQEWKCLSYRLEQIKEGKVR